jgi:hypothetical protein
MARRTAGTFSIIRPTLIIRITFSSEKDGPCSDELHPAQDGQATGTPILTPLHPTCMIPGTIAWPTPGAGNSGHFADSQQSPR